MRSRFIGLFTDDNILKVFGPPPPNHATSSLPQHGFARSSNWEFLGKSSSESLDNKADTTVKLDFGLSSSMITEEFRKAWPYEFGLVYSVTLSPDSLETSLQVQNKGSESFDFHVLLHNYFKVPVGCTSRLHSEMALTRGILGRLQNRCHKSQRQSIHRQSGQ